MTSVPKSSLTEIYHRNLENQKKNIKNHLIQRTESAVEKVFFIIKLSGDLSLIAMGVTAVTLVALGSFEISVGVATIALLLLVEKVSLVGAIILSFLPIILGTVGLIELFKNNQGVVKDEALRNSLNSHENFYREKMIREQLFKEVERAKEARKKREGDLDDLEGNVINAKNRLQIQQIKLEKTLNQAQKAHLNLMKTIKG